jgi:hypothetical protein
MVKKRVAAKMTLNSIEARAHVELCMMIFKILKKINKYLTFPIIFIFMSLLLDFTFEIYGVLRAVYKNDSQFTAIVYNGTIWGFIEIFPIFITIYSAESTWRAVESVKDVNNEILCQGKIFDFNSERIFDYFNKSIEKTRLQASTIFFNLDWKLCFEVNI